MAMADEPDRALMQAAERGDAEAQYNLGVYYEWQHVKVIEGFAKAPAWYRKAAEQGHVAAQKRLGALYEMGKCVERDYQVAAKWYAKAGDKMAAESALKRGDVFGQSLTHLKKSLWIALQIIGAIIVLCFLGMGDRL